MSKLLLYLLFSHIVLLAPMGDGVAHADWETTLPQPEQVSMTGLQIFMAREIGGWPLYTIIIALGQVRTKYTNVAFY